MCILSFCFVRVSRPIINNFSIWNVFVTILEREPPPQNGHGVFGVRVRRAVKIRKTKRLSDSQWFIVWIPVSSAPRVLISTWTRLLLLLLLYSRAHDAEGWKRTCRSRVDEPVGPFTFFARLINYSSRILTFLLLLSFFFFFLYTISTTMLLNTSVPRPGLR